MPRPLARKVLVVSDPGVIAAGWVADVEASLQAIGIDYCLYSAVSPNPRVEEVMLGAEVYRENHCDVIVAIGGGSPMDCGKAIGIVVAHGRCILEFERGHHSCAEPTVDPDPHHRRHVGGCLAVRDHFQSAGTHEVLHRQ